MWNEMVKDEEITFNGEESAHPGMELRAYSIHLTFVFFVSVYDDMEHFCSLSKNNEIQGWGFKTVIFLMELIVNIRISFNYFRRLH